MWDVPWLLRLVSYGGAGEVEGFRMRLEDCIIANGTLAH